MNPSTALGATNPFVRKTDSHLSTILAAVLPHQQIITPTALNPTQKNPVNPINLPLAEKKYLKISKNLLKQSSSF
jgi:hypothetical protein